MGTLATTEARLELYFSLQLSIVTCGIVGAHSVILAVDSYLYTSFSFITLNILKRALHTDFRNAFTTAPLQTNGEVPGQRGPGCSLVTQRTLGICARACWHLTTQIPQMAFMTSGGHRCQTVIFSSSHYNSGMLPREG